MYRVPLTHKILPIGCLIVLFCWFINSTVLPINAQSLWTTPQLLASSPGNIDSPIIISDHFGKMHAFWRYVEPAYSDSDQPPQYIYYSQGDGTSWSRPIDIQYSSISLGPPSAAVDNYGRIHLIFLGKGGVLQYSSSIISQATSAMNWTAPLPLAAANLRAQIAVSPSGYLYVAYGGTADLGPSLVISKDDGQSWSNPESISAPVNIGSSTDFVRLIVTPDEVIHVVWTEFALPGGWPPKGVYYCNSKDFGKSWSTPVQIAGEGFTQISIANFGNDMLHVAWNGMAGVHGRYYRRSTDGGQTWSPVEDITPVGKGGSEGPPQIVVDRFGIVHLLTTDDGCVWYLRFEWGGWTTPFCISKATHIEQASMTLFSGNQLVAFFWQDKTNYYDLLYSKNSLGFISETSIVPEQTATIETKNTENVLPSQNTQSKTPTPRVILSNQDLYNEPLLGRNSVIFIYSIIPIILLILIVLIIRFFKNKI